MFKCTFCIEIAYLTSTIAVTNCKICCFKISPLILDTYKCVNQLGELGKLDNYSKGSGIKMSSHLFIECLESS